MNRWLTGIACATAFTVAACGGGDADTAAPATTTTSATAKVTTTTEPVSSTARATTTTAKSTRCLEVPADKVEGIATGLKGGTTLRSAQAVKSKDYEKVWIISAEIEGPGVEGDDQIGTWASNGLTASEGLILSIDGFAKQFSDWPDGSKSKAGFSQIDDGVKQSRECVKDSL